MSKPLLMVRKLALTVAATVAATDTAPAFGPNVAPNTVRRVFEPASDAVVKLYGGRMGREHGFSTGFLVSADGKIITSLSLLVRGPSVRAVLSDGRVREARLVRSDEYRQLALLKIEGEDLPYLELSSSDRLRVGDPIIALGNWFKIAVGEEPVSVSRGILSLKTNLDARRLAQAFEYGGPVLVVDAITSNPGAPGGPLLDIEGNCVGMIGRIVEAVNTNTRLNYALPSEELMAFLGGDSSSGDQKDKPKEPGAGARPYVGIRISKLGYRHVSAYVARVRPRSPAAEAGIQPDDLIVAIGGRRISDAAAYEEAVKGLDPGQVVQFVAKRGSALLTFEVTVGILE